MSVITNEPILLNETGLLLVDQLKRQNGLLSMIAEGSRSDVYSDITQVASVIRGNTVEENKRLFPIGDQIVVAWKDMDDENHNTDATAYKVPLDIVHHGEVVLESGEVVPGMYLQWHYTTPYGVTFSNRQAFYHCDEALVAGTYYVTLGKTWGSNGTVADSMWKFTLTEDVPEGGCLSGFESMSDVAPTTWKVKSWGVNTDASPIEIVDVTEYNVDTDTATSLGVMEYTEKSAEGLNCMQNVAFGNNRWGTSAIRQYLNADSTNWWESKGVFDIRPEEYTKHGFMAGFRDDFLQAIKPVKVFTALNTVEGYEDSIEETFDTFFLPSLEQMNGTPQLSNVEGPYFEYWRRRLGLSEFASSHPSIYDGYKIPAINSLSSPQSVRLRSAFRSSANSPWYVYSSGYLYGSSAYSAFRFVPACVIC